MTATGQTAAPTSVDVTRSLEGGAAARELFGRLLGLGRAAGATPYAVERVRWLPPRFELLVSAEQGATVEVLLEGRDTYAEVNQAPPLVGTAGVAVWYRNGELPMALQQRIGRIAPKWGDLRVQGLLALLLRDPDVVRFVPEWERLDEEGKTAAEVPPMEDPGLGLRSTMMGLWDSGSLFAELFAADEFNAFPLESIEVSTPFVRVIHSDLECITLGQLDRPSAMTVVDFPWNDIFDDDPELFERYMRSMTLLTDIDEDDVVMGCVGKLQRLLDRVPTDRDETPIFFECSCLPATISEDVDGAVKRFAATCPVPFGQTSRAHESAHINAFEDLLVTRRLAAEQAAGPPDPRAVNLVGFEEDPYTAELRALLTAAGVRVNATLLPDLSPELIERLPAARLHVLLRGSKWWDELYRQLLRDTRSGHIALDAPFGVAGTRAWVAGVLRALELPEDGAEAAFAAHFGDALQARWAALRKRAEDVAIGLVLRDEDLFLLDDAAHTLGIPLLAVLHEMGFRTEVLLRAPAADAERIAAEVLRRHPEPERCTLRPFDTLAELRAALAESAAPAFIGNYTFDWRLSEAGKARIPLRTFKMGVSGALTSLERVLTHCDVPFYRRYGRFLRRSAMGQMPRVSIDRY